MNLEMSCLTL